MFEHMDTPQELFNHNLGAALKMENTVLEMLDENIEHAQDEHLKELFRHHEEETREQIANLERAFAAFGWEADDSSSPAIEGIKKEAKANVKKTDESLVDSVILSGAAETEHHEIAVYENLITGAQAMDRKEVVELLRRNLEQERHTLEEVKGEAEKVAAAVG